MVEQDARRAVHLADDDPLGAVDDEGAVHGHERHVAHVHVLLLDIDDRLGLGVGVDLERGQAQRDAHRRGIGQPALAALVGVIFRRLELITVEVEVGGAGEIFDREDRAKRLFEARDIAGRRIGAEELLIAFALNLDQVRHLRDFVDVAEDLADPPLVGFRPAAGGGSVDRFGRHDIPCAMRHRRCLAGPGPAGASMDSRRCGNTDVERFPRCSSPMRSARAQFGPCPGEDGKSSGRTTGCGGADLFGCTRYTLFCRLRKRGKAGGPISGGPWRAGRGRARRRPRQSARRFRSATSAAATCRARALRR